MSIPIVRTGTVAFIVSGRPQRRSAVSTLVRLILNQTPLRGLRAKPGTRARPRRHRRDVYDDLSSTTAAPGCPYEGGSPYESPLALLAPRDLYMEAPRLGRGVADLGRTYAGAARRDWRPVTPAQAHAADASVSISTKLTTGGRGQM